jgi:hypothetical protein
MNKTKLCPRNVSEWLKLNINGKDLIFTRCATLFELITNELNQNKLYLGVDNNILMIKLCEFFFNNSYIEFNR